MMARRLPELFTGFAVIIVAAVFLVYALTESGTVTTSGYPLQAQFSSIGSLTVGADVKIGGVVIGHVADERLDPNTYAAIVRLVIDNGIKVPEDSSATIASDGLLGGNYVSVSPGGSNTMLAAGQSFSVTQSAINIEDLLGKFIFSMGGTPGKPSAPAQGSGASVPANPAALSPAAAK
ncbi:outer membrane lipid asymmetry maintenance protein MlaD [Acidocella sp.]|uniref:outer membrane lipid asymmetry maintenance protein MlaD n=1 Tax=Acidocella sp. TaxID=50710 RepID=UPI00178E60E1|nr:outer membrane lipid asymmetry maintenance protein MlaD [Acidocella sp.]NNM55594.1 outer membrane lipid asymmetry maintenance protein MlaD [Acidocella sp.]